MGNLFTSNIPLESRSRAPMLRSIFETNQVSNDLQQLSCDVVFGSPSAECSGTGVCKISAYGTMNSTEKKLSSCRYAPAILIPLDNGAGVSLVIAREMMCIKLLRTQFRHGVFNLNESYSLPSNIVKVLALKIKELKPGKYTVEEAGGFFRIKFY